MIENSNSDKVSHHGYHRFYPWFLAHLQGQDINLLEIGIDRTESLKLWKGYFGKINLHGIDIAEKNFMTKKFLYIELIKAVMLSWRILPKILA